MSKEGDLRGAFVSGLNLMPNSEYIFIALYDMWIASIADWDEDYKCEFLDTIKLYVSSFHRDMIDKRIDEYLLFGYF